MPSLKTIFQREKKQATSEEIRAVAGPLDEVILAAILRTGATADEVTQAVQRLEENDYTKPVSTKPMDERVRDVYNILDYERNFVQIKPL